MKKIILLALGLLLATASFVSAGDGAGKFVEVGEKVPNFSIEMLDGSRVELESLRGKVVVLNFWATWCPYCIEELKYVQEGIIDRFAGEDLVFIAVSRGEEREKVFKFAREKGYGFPVGLDRDESVFRLFADKSIPRNFIISRDGMLAHSELGFTEELFGELQEKIAETLKN